MDLDLLDILLLNQVQFDTKASVKDIADDVGLSANACWRRIRSLEDRGYIVKHVALLSADRLGVGLTVFANIRTVDDSSVDEPSLASFVRKVPEIVDFHRTMGVFSYHMKLRVADIHHCDRIFKQLGEVIRIAELNTSFAVDEIKSTTQVPTGIAQRSAAEPDGGEKNT